MRRLAVCLILAFACTVAWAVSADVAPTDSTAQDIESQAATGSPPDKTTSEDLAPEIPSPIKPSTPLGPIEEPAAVQDMGSGFIHLSADSIRTTSDEEGRPLLTIASGNIMARYRNMSVTAQRGTVNYKNNLAVFDEDVVFKMGIQEARGERIEIDMQTMNWSIDAANIAVSPEFAKGMIKAPIFAGSRKISGLRDREVSSYDSRVTTCNLEHAHYDIVAREMTVYPNDKIVFKNAHFIVLGRKLFGLKRYVVPIKDVYRNPNLIPVFGQSAEEGMYLKLGYSALATKSHTTYLLADFMQKKGIGLGIRNNYKIRSGDGELYFYALDDKSLDQRTFSGRLTHTQMIGNIRLQASSDFRANSYVYAPESKSFENRLLLSRNTSLARSSISIRQSISRVYERTTTLSALAQHRQYFGDRSYLDTSFNYTDYNSSTGSRARLVSQALFSQKTDKFDWDISAQKITDLSDEAFVGKGQFGGIERLPELSISSDSARLGRLMPLKLPLQMKFSYGRLVQLPLSEIDRGFLDITAPVTHYTLSNSWSAAVGAGFKQYVYGDGTAQYSLEADTRMSKKLGDSSTFSLTYRYQRPKGYTPYRFDYIGKYNIINANLDLTDNEKLNVSLIGGYNFEQPSYPWQDSIVRISYTPTNSVLFYTATGYDFNRSQWRQVINQLRIRAKDSFKLDVGTRYDPLNKRLATIRTVLDTYIGKKNHIQALAGWNGFTKTFDYKGFSITRDLHCWEAALTYIDQSGFYEDKGIYFTMRIKAFPMMDTFGIGSFGQALDTSVGQVY
ncbi:MAG: hypothetical protein GX139_11395 [Armatimonadetes bacterium]|nr:hypothetical protein [Armatimonadota bacterium]